MTKLEALRRHALAHGPTCRRIARNCQNDDQIAGILNDAGSLESFIRSAVRLNREELNSLISPLVTEGADSAPASLSDVETVKTRAYYG